MRILVTKDASTKIPREIADLDEARNIASIGFHVELLNDDGSTEPLPEPEADQLPEVEAAAPEQAEAPAAAKKR